MSNVMIIGATSAIAVAFARRAATRGARLCLAARDPARVQALAQDLAVRGAAAVTTVVLDVTRFDTHASNIESAWRELGGADVVLIAQGTLPDQARSEVDFEQQHAALEVNTLGVMSVLTHLSPLMVERGRGTLVVLGSVAGDRGRRSNYVYGTCKAAVDTYCQGLRARLHADGVHVLTIKPGFVDTPMTAAFRKGPLWSSPERIASGIDNAIRRRRNVVYLPWFWVPIMWVIRIIPEFLFKRLPL